MKNTFGEKVIEFFENLEAPEKLPGGVKVLNPYKEPAVKRSVRSFYERYYDDTRKRVFVLGINPGRFGSGVTGISFTDPYELSESCGIAHPFEGQREISARFVYEVISACGGPEKFYKNFYLTSICPLGFVKGARNFNYYDDREVFESLKPFIVESIKRQKAFGVNDTAIILGTGKNQKFFKTLNDEYGFFKDFVTLPHPRYVMQYKSKEKPAYIRRFKATFEGVI